MGSLLPRDPTLGGFGHLAFGFWLLGCFFLLACAVKSQGEGCNSDHSGMGRGPPVLPMNRLCLVATKAPQYPFVAPFASVALQSFVAQKHHSAAISGSCTAVVPWYTASTTTFWTSFGVVLD